MKEMLDAAHNQTVMSQASVYHWYKFKSSGKKTELMGGPGTPMTTLIKPKLALAQP